MALAGRFESTTRTITATLDWGVQSQDVANNRSVVKATLYISSPYRMSASAPKKAQITINGVTSTENTYYIGSHSGAWEVQAATFTVTVPHNSDGSKSVAISAWATIDATISGSLLSKVSVSGNASLNAIPRASSFASLPSTATLGHGFSFSIKKATSSFTHDIVVSLGTASATLNNTSVNGGSYTFPTSWGNQISTSTTRTATLTLRTYNGSTKVGETKRSITVYVPASWAPTINSVTISEANAAVTKVTPGVWVQNQSKVGVVVATSPGAGASVSRIAVTEGGSTRYGSNTSWTLTSAGTRTISITVADSRGRTATTSRAITVEAWKPPVLNIESVYRSDSAGVSANEGTYATIKATCSISSVAGKNSATPYLQFRPEGADWNDPGAGSTPLSDGTTIFGGELSPDSRYLVDVFVKDKFGVASWSGAVSSAFVTMDFKDGGKGVAFGKVAELENTLDVNFVLRASGGVDFIEIPSGANLNDYTTPGVYVIPGTDVATTIANLPHVRAQSLEVLNVGGLARKQRVSTAGGEEYVRVGYPGNWGVWHANHSTRGAISLQNGWTAYGAGYAQPAWTASRGAVFLEGSIKSGSVTGEIGRFTLPKGYHFGSRIHTCAGLTPVSATCRIDVQTSSSDNTAIIRGIANVNSGWTTLSGIVIPLEG